MLSLVFVESGHKGDLMAKYHVTGEGRNKNSNNKIDLNFEITANSSAEARSLAKSEAQKKHPGYNITSIIVKEK